MGRNNIDAKWLHDKGLVWSEKDKAYIVKLNATSVTSTSINTANFGTFQNLSSYNPTRQNYLKLPKDFVKLVAIHTKLSLVLRGRPMPKQSVRSTKSGHFFQPVEMKERVKDYQNQIVQQLPEQFKMFTKQVHILKLHYIYAPLKSFSKIQMDKLKAGEIIYKNTRPDLSDNLKKLVLDSLSELVYSDDSIIVSEDNVKKYFGLQDAILIDLEGL